MYLSILFLNYYLSVLTSIKILNKKHFYLYKILDQIKQFTSNNMAQVF